MMPACFQHFDRSKLEGFIAAGHDPEHATAMKKRSLPPAFIFLPQLESARGHFRVRLIWAVGTAHDASLSRRKTTANYRVPMRRQCDAGAAFEEMEGGPAAEGSGADDRDVWLGDRHARLVRDESISPAPRRTRTLCSVTTTKHPCQASTFSNRKTCSVRVTRLRRLGWRSRMRAIPIMTAWRKPSLVGEIEVLRYQKTSLALRYGPNVIVLRSGESLFRNCVNIVTEGA